MSTLPSPFLPAQITPRPRRDVTKRRSSISIVFDLEGFGTVCSQENPCSVPAEQDTISHCNEEFETRDVGADKVKLA